jgi:hypothetical protein
MRFKALFYIAEGVESIIEVNAQEGALKCEIRACHFVRFRKNVSKRNVKKIPVGIF